MDFKIQTQDSHVKDRRERKARSNNAEVLVHKLPAKSDAPRRFDASVKGECREGVAERLADEHLRIHLEKGGNSVQPGSPWSEFSDKRPSGAGEIERGNKRETVKVKRVGQVAGTRREGWRTRWKEAAERKTGGLFRSWRCASLSGRAGEVRRVWTRVDRMRAQFSAYVFGTWGGFGARRVETRKREKGRGEEGKKERDSVLEREK